MDDVLGNWTYVCRNLYLSRVDISNSAGFLERTKWRHWHYGDYKIWPSLQLTVAEMALLHLYWGTWGRIWQRCKWPIYEISSAKYRDSSNVFTHTEAGSSVRQMKWIYQEEKSHCKNKVLMCIRKKVRKRAFLLFQITQKKKKKKRQSNQKVDKP